MSPVVPPFLRREGFGTLGSSFAEPRLPEAVSLLPRTLGAWLTLVLLVALLLTAAVSIALRWRKRRHRRAAQRELAELRALWNSAERAQLLGRVLAILKSCALQSFGRSQVAALSGARWREFLQHTAPSAGFAGRAGETLLRLSTRGAEAVADDEVEPLMQASEAWIRRHRVGA